MALPFDLRVFAISASGQSNDQEGKFLESVVREGARPSRAIIIPGSVVDGVRNGDVELLRELVRLIYLPLTRFAATLVGSRDAAEDIVQDVFTILWDTRAHWNPPGDPAAYLFASVRNRSLNELRRRAREGRRAQQGHEELHSVDALESRSTEGALDDIIRLETDSVRDRAVTEILVTLTERQRTAYDLRYRRGLTAPAIAGILGITVKSAEQLIGRVTHLVRERLLARVGLR